MEFINSTEKITEDLFELETFEKPFLEFKIEQIKKELAQRKRTIEKEFYDLLSEAIAPVVETTVSFSQKMIGTYFNI
jgi:hypothetical protein